MPTGRPPTSRQCAWQQSSTTARSVARGDARERRHVRGLAVQVHRQQGARARRQTSASACAASSVSRPGRCRRTPGVAPAVDHGERRVRRRQRRRDHLVARHRCRARAASSAIASVPVPTPTACAAPLARGEGASRTASTSGPSTNQPLATTRVDRGANRTSRVLSPA